ncbi:unnamed protein product [Rotaria sordida]|uniref:Uncharacterized protein n=1 Tax=Rotaria sordida TaxID=392033 RepID=A0A819SIW4_9BILA|nr:unnamed protein product [Rotaria sordida]CAF1336305.1 unnamed protein product [Rotaria sordida]CAF1410825.1 unnamed protein product [Rotaria sordida]CAF1439669.1 unnamed protein product [Rotaria sordida]CAF1594453.1 unnamed protein product [Rotaria sordida]
MSSAQKDTKTVQAAVIANAHISGQETPDSDPRKRADRENEGRLSGDQFTIAETPVFHINPTVGTKK